jgi:hypothetical protein
MPFSLVHVLPSIVYLSVTVMDQRRKRRRAFVVMICEFIGRRGRHGNGEL